MHTQTHMNSHAHLQAHARMCTTASHILKRTCWTEHTYTHTVEATHLCTLNTLTPACHLLGLLGLTVLFVLASLCES